MFALTESQKQLQTTAREFAQKEIAPRAAEIDRTEPVSYTHLTLPTNRVGSEMCIRDRY